MRKQPQFWLWRKIACRIPESIRRYWTSRWQKIGQKKYNFLNDLAKAPDVLLEFMLSSLLHLNSSELHFGQSEFKAPHGENKNDNMTYLIGLLYRLTVIMVVKFLVYLKCSINIIIGEGNGTPLQYSCLENPMDGGAWWAAVHGGAKVRQDSETSLSLFTFLHWRRQWQPTPVFLPGDSQGRASLVGCRLWGSRESDTTEAT